jgi:nucleoid-associated protein YgaU
LISSEPAAIASTAPDPTTEDVPETPDFGATPAALTERATPVDPAPPATPEAVALGAPSPLDSPETPTIDAAAPSVVPLHTEGPRPDLSAMESTPGLDAAGAVPTPAGLSDLSPAPSASQPSEPITLAPATPSQPAISAGQPAVPLFPEELPTRRTSPEITSDELFAAADREPEDLVAPPSSVGAISHVVRSGENFWTIAKRYYGSGRFYRALWKANQDVAAEVDQLYVGTKLVIPPAERLDRRYIDPPRRPRSETPQTDEPISRSRLDTNAPRDDRAVRATGREPVASDHAPIRTRVHVTRPYETLRSIARKELGDSRRAAELLELNADLVDDPNHLPVGIPLRVPDDR